MFGFLTGGEYPINREVFNNLLIAVAVDDEDVRLPTATVGNVPNGWVDAMPFV
ncbi:MAG: hypothetical protein WCH75_05590 [Candidatus Binatia bacterium]